MNRANAGMLVYSRLPLDYPMTRAAWLDLIDSGSTTPRCAVTTTPSSVGIGSPGRGVVVTADLGVVVTVPRAVVVTAEGIAWPARHVRALAGGVVAPW